MIKFMLSRKLHNWGFMAWIPFLLLATLRPFLIVSPKMQFYNFLLSLRRPESFKLFCAVAIDKLCRIRSPFPINKLHVVRGRIANSKQAKQQQHKTPNRSKLFGYFIALFLFICASPAHVGVEREGEGRESEQ